MGKLSGKVAIITGAGSGMGRASSLLFAQEGATVAAADMSEPSVKETVAQIAGEGGQAIALKVDVSKAAEVERMVSDTVRHFGQLDIIYNNAGIWRSAQTHTMSIEDWHRIIDVDLHGVFYGCRYALPEMMKRGGGVILSTSSVAGVAGVSQNAHYCAAKHGVIGLTRSIAIDYAQHNVRINCICPGSIDTNLTAHLTATMTHEQREEMRRGGASVNPQNRWGTPEEIARLALFLCSDDSAFITGQAYVIDGGQIAGVYYPNLGQS
jgi:meso-butanediol dehydrogenase/(S,S)-butanediol dehydrogenase/diacetyl reductase